MSAPEVEAGPAPPPEPPADVPNVKKARLQDAVAVAETAASTVAPMGNPADCLVPLNLKASSHTTSGVGGVNIEAAQARDAHNQAWVDLGSRLIGAVPVPGGSAVGVVVSQGPPARSVRP